MTSNTNKTPNAVTLVNELSALSVMTTVEELKKLFTEAKREITGHWCKGHLAVTADGQSVLTTDPKGCSFCVLGAMYRGHRLAVGLPVLGPANWLEDDKTYDMLIKIDDRCIFIARVFYKHFLDTLSDDAPIWLAGFNDALTTTEADVIGFFDFCLTLLEN